MRSDQPPLQRRCRGDRELDRQAVALPSGMPLNLLPSPQVCQGSCCPPLGYATEAAALALGMPLRLVRSSKVCQERRCAFVSSVSLLLLPEERSSLPIRYPMGYQMAPGSSSNRPLCCSARPEPRALHLCSCCEGPNPLAHPLWCLLCIFFLSQSLCAALVWLIPLLWCSLDTLC